MRSGLMIGLAAGAVAICGGALFVVLHRGDPLAIGRHLMEQGDMHRASLYLLDAVRKHPDNAEAAYRLGVADLALGNPAAAELELKRARERGYDPKPILLPLGQAYLQQHQNDQLLRDFDVSGAPAWAVADTDALRSAAHLALGNVQAAQADATAAEAAAPHSTIAMLASARVAIAQGDVARASAKVASVLQADPKQPDALLLRAGMATSHEDPKAALADADAVLAGNPRRTDAKLMRVRALAMLGRESEARALVDEVLHNAHRDPGANYLRLVLAVRSHDWQAADQSLDVISPIIGNLPRGLYYMGLVKLNVGQPAQAEEAVAKFLTAHPDDVEAHKLMAFILLSRRRPAEARAQLQDIVASGHADADSLDLMGRAQAMAGDARGAETSLAQAQAMAPNDRNILNRLAGVRLALGETGQADHDLRQSLSIDPHQATAGETLVGSLLASGDVAGAQAALAGLKQSLGDGEATGLLQAEVQLAGFDLPATQATLQDVLKRFPDSERAVTMLARVDAQRGQTDAAEALLGDRLHRHPDDIAALQLDLQMLLAQGKTDQAVSLATAAYEAAAAKPGIVAALAATYLRAHNPDRALALLDRAGAQDPALTLLRARALVIAKRNDDALDAYHDVLEAVPGNAEVRREMAMLQAAGHDIDSARVTLRDGLRAAPGNALLMGALVGLDLKSGGTAEALRTASALAADSANLPDARLLAGDIWTAAGDPARAADAYVAAYKAAPSTLLAVHAADGLAHAGRGAAATALLEAWLVKQPDDVPALSLLSSLDLAQNQLPQAAAHLQHLVALRPADAAALNNLAWLLGRQGDLDAALALAKRAYFLAPQANTADTLGWILLRRGDADGAVALLRMASQSGHAPDQLFHYAAALAETGQKDQARQVVQQVLTQKAAFGERPDAQKLLDSLTH